MCINANLCDTFWNCCFQDVSEDQAELILYPVRFCDAEACRYLRMKDASAELFFMLYHLIWN